MITLRVQARMCEPIAYYGDGIHLDGILGIGAIRALPEAERRALPPLIGDEKPRDFDLPLARVDCGPDAPWIWAASAERADWVQAGILERRRRGIEDDLARWSTVDRIEVKSGRFKPWDLRYPTLTARVLEWRAVGDPDGVRHLLGFVQSIGKHASAGSGRVAEWSVEPVEGDESLMVGGVAARNLPKALAGRLGASGVAKVASVRVPYWHHSRRCECVCPMPPDVGHG